MVEGGKISKAEGGLDRLNSLDDSLLLIILGFMETLDVVRLCVLSRRCRHLWCFLPILDFNDQKHIGKHPVFSFSDLVIQVRLMTGPISSSWVVRWASIKI